MLEDHPAKCDARVYIEVGAVGQDGFMGCCVRDDGAGIDQVRADKLIVPVARLHGVGGRPGEGATFCLVSG